MKFHNWWLQCATQIYNFRANSDYIALLLDTSRNAMESYNALQNLQRDLIAFTESKLQNIDRLSAELDASVNELKKLLEKTRKKEESRNAVNPTSTPKRDTLNIEGEEYRVTEDFRQAAIQVSDELDLDELEAAKLCIDVGSGSEDLPDTNLPYRALLRFQNYRYVTLNCVRLLLLQTVDLDVGDEIGAAFQDLARRVIRGGDGNQDGASLYWRKCMEGLSEIEEYLQKGSNHRQTALMTGIPLQGDLEDALIAQRLLLVQQHECLAAVMSYLIRGGHVEATDFRSLLSKAATLETPLDVTIHYLPIIISGSAYFATDATTTFETAKGIHSLFAAGPGQQQWKQPKLRAAATVCWLVEYSSRFADPTSAQTLRVADRQKEEEERSKLFFDAVDGNAFQFILAACRSLKPEVWHDPAKVELVRFLLDDMSAITGDTNMASPEFAALMMGELQAFSDAFVSNLPDDLRRLQMEEDDYRRNIFSGPPEASQQETFNVERFLVIMAYAFQDDPEAAQDFWSDRESNLYGFLGWASKRLPTPRVAAFCELLRSIAGDEKSANQAHLFLLDDSAMTTGKLRKTYSVSWAQIFSELGIYAASVKDKPATSQQTSSQAENDPETSYVEPETYIMLESYLRLASHVCRTSPDARNWLLRGQSFHIGEILFRLASTGNEHRLHASCFDFLAALLTDKIEEVNNGTWVLLDNWISSGGPAGSTQSKPGRQSSTQRQYLQNYAAHLDSATGLVNLLNALVVPTRSQSDLVSDTIPFPENLGASSRHTGIDAYVDFVLGPVFRSTKLAMETGVNRVEVDVLRCACLEFVCICLSTFNEDLVALANAAVSVDSAMKTSSLANYAKLHPFSRVMEWLFNNNVITILASTAQQSIDDLNSVDAGSPPVQATLKSVQVMNLAMRLQTTYFDIVRPLVARERPQQTQLVANSAMASYDEVMISQIGVLANIVSFAASNYVDLSLEALSFLQKLCASRRLGEASHHGDGGRLRIGNRLVGQLAESSEAIATELQPYFQVFEWDLENGEQPLKLIRAKALLKVLNRSLDTSAGRPSVAHSLLGFACHARTVSVEPGGAFSQGQSLFHSLVAYAAQSPYAIGENNVSWLLAVKRGCSDVVLKLALSPLTAFIVMPELRAMDYLAASSQNQLLALANPLWDQKTLRDPSLLLDSSAQGVRDFLHIRENYFEYAALDLRAVNESHAYSVQEKIINALLGEINFPNGEQARTDSIFDLLDFLDIETVGASDASCKYFKNVDLSACVKDDPEIVTAFDVGMVEQLLILRKRELINNGGIQDAHADLQADDEMRAILASLTSQNKWRAIQSARMGALEAWTDLLSLMATATSSEVENASAVALQGLQVVLPRFEKALLENMDFAALLAKLTLTLVAAAAARSKENSNRSANLTHERLLSAFRICLKVVTDSDTGLALRDVCYRTCCAVLTCVPLMIVNDQPSPSPIAKQILQLVQSTGDRLIIVITEDAFSGRGVTRVSALLFLDALIGVFQLSKITSSMLRALIKLNFVPVLIDQSVGSVASSFQGDNQELITSVAYFHTALSLLLRICQTTDGTQLVLNSGFFAAVQDSKLFSTDPDIGLDIDNPVALREFYRLLAAVLRVVTAVVISRGSGNTSVLHQAKSFLQQNRFSMQAVFKRTSAVQKTAGPPEKEAKDVAEEFSKLLLVTGFLEVSWPADNRLQCKTNAALG